MTQLSISDEEMDLVVQRDRERLAAGGTPDAKTLRSYLDDLDADGRWSDVAYDDDTRAAWDPGRALERLTELTRAYHDSDHPMAGDDAIRDAVVRATTYWLGRDPRSDNWWWFDIGVPMRMRRILVLGDDWFDGEVRANLLDVLGRVETHGTGANLLHTAEIELLGACLVGDEERAVRATEQTVEEVRVTTEEGIQYDWSFHQHGPTFQQYSYGSEFLDSAVSFAALVRGTGCAFPREKLYVLANLALEGDRWMQRGGIASPSTLDRAVSRRGKLRVFEEKYRRLATLIDDVADDLHALADYVDSGVPAEGAVVTGHRHYWHSDFTVHQRPEFFASLKTVSERTNTTESINEENLKGDYQTAGALHVIREGDEYEGIFPVWDWTRIPGVTAYDDRLTEPAKRAFVGGVASDGRGVDVFDYAVADGSLTARKGYFFGDDAVACLGAGVTADDGRVRTSIDQRHRRGDAVLLTPDGTRQLNGGFEASTELLGVRHDGITYSFPTPTTATVSTREQSGSWRAINHQYDAEPVTAPVFSAWVDHGNRPTGERYAYVIAPTDGDDSAACLKANDSVTVVQNDTAQQAVSFDDEGVLQVIFHEPGTVRIGDVELSAESPCLVQVREYERTVTVGAPAHRSGSLSATVNGADVEAIVPPGASAPPQTTVDY